MRTNIDTCPRMVELIDENNVDAFNKMVEDNKAPDLRDKNLSGLDLSKANLKGLDLSGSYFRNTNLKGLDLTGCNLQGASIHNARISGVLFPEDLSPDEIIMSVTYGTRMRVFPKK